MIALPTWTANDEYNAVGANAAKAPCPPAPGKLLQFSFAKDIKRNPELAKAARAELLSGTPPLSSPLSGGPGGLQYLQHDAEIDRQVLLHLFAAAAMLLWIVVCALFVPAVQPAGPQQCGSQVRPKSMAGLQYQCINLLSLHPCCLQTAVIDQLDRDAKQESNINQVGQLEGPQQRAAPALAALPVAPSAVVATPGCTFAGALSSPTLSGCRGWRA